MSVGMGAAVAAIGGKLCWAAPRLCWLLLAASASAPDESETEEPKIGCVAQPLKQPRRAT